ncbi:hypothetical protein HYX19_00010 [Candidatus Woesearchaeota archaeon]|nr:hypothetical protein [Candidatus Woesearchaeota archaeon]
MRKNLIYIILVLIFVGIVLAEITFINESPGGGVTLTTVDTTTATPISSTTTTPQENWAATPDGSGYYSPGSSSTQVENYNYKTGESDKYYVSTGSAPTSSGGTPPSGRSPTVTTTAPTPTYYDDGGYTPPYSPPCDCSAGQVDVSTTTCNNGCGLQVRSCDGCYWSSQNCDNNRRPTGVPATETSCSDNLDNNCDGNEADYDGGTIKNKGDPNCKVSLDSVSTIVNNPNENDALEVTCTANAGNLRSIKASIGGVDCTAGVKTGNSYRFNCNAGTVTQASSGKEVKCYVDASRSYQEGTDKTVNVDVCKLISAEWGNANARQYENVELMVITTQGCNGKEVKFFVKNVQTGRSASFAPRSVNVVNGRASSSWTVEFESLDGQNPLYYFTAAID